MLPVAVEFFKRNPEAKACHVVLDQVFTSAVAANTYKKALRAHKVTAFTKAEYDKYIKSLSAKDNIAEPAKNDIASGRRQAITNLTQH